MVIGRVPACDVHLNDKRLSSKHCQLEKKGDKIILTDLSTNGTYIKD
jgi:pSer/pThr/pTyr-binding forkhead associated (FHA) protein